jgi:hypothetical protein
MWTFASGLFIYMIVHILIILLLRNRFRNTKNRGIKILCKWTLMFITPMPAWGLLRITTKL